MNLKSILLAAIFGASLLASAITVAAPEVTTFQAEKERHIANILARIQIDQKNLSCVQTAQDDAALKACDATGKQDHETLEPKAEEQVVDKKAPIADKKHQKAQKIKPSKARP
jgi:hypothetical protein